MFHYILICIIIALFGVLNYFIGLRGWQFIGSRLPFVSLEVYGILFAVVVIISFVGITANKFLPYFLRSSFYIIGAYWIAALTYFTLIIVILDIVRLLNRWINFTPKVIWNSSDFTLILGSFVIIFVAVLLVYGTFQARNIKVTSYNINIPKQAGSLSKLHIAMISDIHINNIDDKRQAKIINIINQLNPDLVLIPGDIIEDTEIFDKRDMARDFQNIKSKYGIYVSLGNHDYLNRDLTYLTDQLNKVGINVLRDSRVKVGDSFYIIGREDKFYESLSRKKRMELSKLVDGINRELPVIVLDHQPVNLEEAEKVGVDLQLSGHTHKGQFFPFNLITDKVFKIDYGYLKTGSLQVIVSSGASTWGPPVRIGSTSEVVDIMVNFSKI